VNRESVSVRNLTSPLQPWTVYSRRGWEAGCVWNVAVLCRFRDAMHTYSQAEPVQWAESAARRI